MKFNLRSHTLRQQIVNDYRSLDTDCCFRGKSLNVVQPTLPPLEELLPFLERIWRSKTLTNNGPIHEEFEQSLATFLGVEHITLFKNATTALICAINAAVTLGSEVITSPFSFVASASSILFAGHSPKFVDIQESGFNIDPNKVEAQLCERTAAILAVHCYGYPCDLKSLSYLSSRHELPLVYDGSHAFGIKPEGLSIHDGNHLTVLSFHATKVFNTFEGGAVVSGSRNEKLKLDKLKNFGFSGEFTVDEIGLNGKMSEFNAAVGICQLAHYQQNIEKRKKIFTIYNSNLANLQVIETPLDYEGYNYAYFPVLLPESGSITAEALYDFLRTHYVYARRYFHPLISEFSAFLKDTSSEAAAALTPISREKSRRVLCLPIYPELSIEDVLGICHLIKTFVERKGT